MSNGFPKFIGLTLTKSGGMLGAWEDGSVARWVPQTHDGFDRGVMLNPRGGYWVAIPSPDYEALFCTTTDNTSIADASFVLRPHTRATDTLNLELAPEVQVDD